MIVNGSVGRRVNANPNNRNGKGRAFNSVSTRNQRISGIVPSNRMGYGSYGASRSKIANEAWKAASGSADDDIIYNLPLLRVRSRDLFMGSPIAGAAILTLRTNTIGTGLLPLPKIDGERLGMTADETAKTNNMIKEEFSLYADTVECDWNRRNTFYELEDLAFCNAAISGDILGLLPMKERRGSYYETKIRLIEADRVADPRQNSGTISSGVKKIYGGVELTDDGELDAYWVTDRHPGYSGYTPMSNGIIRVPAFGEETGRPVAMLVSEMERPEQRRGVPLMSKCLTELKQLQRYIESTTIQNVIKSYFTCFVEAEMPSADMFERILSDDDIGDILQRNPYDIRLAPGIINWCRPGEKVSFPVNAGPEAQFEPYVIAMCKFVGACLGIPFEVLLKQFSASYSASRAALLEFWPRVKQLRKLMINQFCQPVYTSWMMEAIAKGVWKAPGFFDDIRIRQAWLRCLWAGASPGSIDPLREIMASEHKVRLGVSTLEIESLEINGSDWRQNTIQADIENTLCANRGLTYIRNLDSKGMPILTLGISDENGDGSTNVVVEEPKQTEEELAA